MRWEWDWSIIARECFNAHIRLELLYFPVERVREVPGGHDGDVDGQQDSDNQEQLGVFHHLQHNKLSEIWSLIKQNIFSMMTKLSDFHKLVLKVFQHKYDWEKLLL